MSSIDDVARAAGVSTATVSRALRGLPNVSAETRESVRACAEALGYVASVGASGLATGRTLAMGVVVPSVSRWFYTAVIEGIDAELRAASYDMILFNLGGRTGDRERVFHRSILRKRTDALIALCLNFTADERDQLTTTGQPAIVVGGPVRGLRHIGIDEKHVAELATNHLIGLGHGSIAMIGGPDEEGMNRQVPIGRRKGFERALAAADIPVQQQWMLQGGFSIAHSRAAMNTLLSSNATRPTAVFAASDEMAIGAMLAITDHGLSVPGDFSVIGIDNHDLAESFGLTTIAQDPFKQGALGARMMLAELSGGPAQATSVNAATHLLLRSSTASPNLQL